MSVLSRSRWLNRLAVVLVAGVSLAAITLAAAPAQARVSVGVGVPFPGAFGYYAPPPYYASPYGYPYYGYLPTHILAAFSSAEPSARIIITIIGDDDPVTPEPGGPVQPG